MVNEPGDGKCALEPDIVLPQVEGLQRGLGVLYEAEQMRHPSVANSQLRYVQMHEGGKCKAWPHALAP